MKGGVRVVHTTKRNGFYVIADPTRPLSGWRDGLVSRDCLDCTKIFQTLTRHPREFHVCPTCSEIHTHKTYHILLNGDGAAVVSPTVHQGLRRAGAYDVLGGLSVEAEVSDPPKVVLGAKNGNMAPIPQRDKITVYHE